MSICPGSQLQQDGPSAPRKAFTGIARRLRRVPPRGETTRTPWLVHLKIANEPSEMLPGSVFSPVRHCRNDTNYRLSDTFGRSFCGVSSADLPHYRSEPADHPFRACGRARGEGEAGGLARSALDDRLKADRRPVSPSAEGKGLTHSAGLHTGTPDATIAPGGGT